MVNQPNNARSAASRQAIEAALINLLQDRDLSAISVKAICSQAGGVEKHFLFAITTISTP